MLKDTEQNTLTAELEYTFLSLISKKTRVLIIGGGRAGYIKAKSFTSSLCNVWIISPKLCDEFSTLKDFSNLIQIQDAYNTDYILDKHIIVIATGDEKIDTEIACDCEKYAKLYLFCSDYRKGNIIKPLQRETRSVTFSLHSKSGNPNASLFSAELIKETLVEYDDFINYINSLRNKIKSKSYKDEIMKFVSTKDFHFFYNNNAADLVLQLFYSNYENEE